MRGVACGSLGFLGLLLMACGTEPPDSPGAVRVTVTTGGEDLDLDGYQVRVDQAEVREVSQYATEVFTDLAPGAHLVELLGVAGNCQVAPGASREVTVVPDDTTAVGFGVVCLATGLVVRARVTGLDLDLHYTASIDGTSHGLAAFGAVVVTRLQPGPHLLALGDVAENCTVAGPNPRTVVVPPLRVVEEPFDINCVSRSGVLVVTVVATGDDPDLTGYAVRLNEVLEHPVPPSGSRVVSDLAAGEYRVDLAGVDPHCVAVTGPQNVRITTGGATRDTARVTFAVECGRAWTLAFARGEHVMLAGAQPAEPVALRRGGIPAWAPDGARVALECEGAICVVGMDGVTRLEIRNESGFYGEPAWRPDGKLSFTSWVCGYYCYDTYFLFAGLVLVTPDGSNRTVVPLPGAILAAAHPDWSPDGARVAVSCQTVGAPGLGICVVQPNGSFQRLTSGTFFDTNPAWSPDGSVIAFATNRFGPTEELALVDLEGRVTRVAPGVAGRTPAWSPDGERLTFAGGGTPGQPVAGLFEIGRNGQGLVRLTVGSDQDPVWRPR